MAHPIEHAKSSARQFGGAPEDYLRIHEWFDESKAQVADFRHRSLRHHAEGIFQAERLFGVTIRNSAGKDVPVRYIGEQHVRESLVSGLDRRAASPAVDVWATVESSGRTLSVAYKVPCVRSGRTRPRASKRVSRNVGSMHGRRALSRPLLSRFELAQYKPRGTAASDEHRARGLWTDRRSGVTHDPADSR